MCNKLLLVNTLPYFIIANVVIMNSTATKKMPERQNNGRFVVTLFDLGGNICVFISFTYDCLCRLRINHHIIVHIDEMGNKKEIIV